MNLENDTIVTENAQLQIATEKRYFAREIMSELIAERKRQGLTQKRIADMTGMKVSNVTRIESCRSMPTLDVLMRYSKAVGKKLQFVLVDEE